MVGWQYWFGLESRACQQSCEPVNPRFKTLNVISDGFPAGSGTWVQEGLGFAVQTPLEQILQSTATQ